MRKGYSIRWRNGRAYARISWRGTRYEFAIGAVTPADAERVARAHYADLEAGRTTPDANHTTIAELWADLVCDYQIKGQRVDDLAKRWLHIEPAFGRDRATDVTTPRLRKYVERRLAEGAAAATVRNELAALRRALTLGYEAGRVARVPAFPRLRVDNARRGFLRAEQYERLRAELPYYLRVPAMLAFWLGWRRGEVLSLEWRQVDLETGEVRLYTSKNGDPRVAYLPPEALAELREWRRHTDAVERERAMIVRHVCHRDGRPIRDHYTAWRSACARAGVPGFLLHDMRRTAARNYVRSGVPQRIAMDITGHRTDAMFRRYDIVDDRDRREAAERVVPVGGDRAANVVAL